MNLTFGEHGASSTGKPAPVLAAAVLVFEEVCLSMGPSDETGILVVGGGVRSGGVIGAGVVVEAGASLSR